MSSFHFNHDQVAPVDPPMTRRDYIAPILINMYNEQCDHVHSRFCESFSKYRQVVVEWMVDVAEYFNLDITTTHAAVAYLDRLQPTDKYSRYEWQMMAICCIIIASKYNEREEDVPPLRKLEEITQQRISNEVILNYELWALKRMSWKLNTRTPISFLSAYMELGVLRPGDIQLKSTLPVSPRSPTPLFSSASSSRCASPSPMSSPSYERNTNREMIKEELHKTIKQLANKCMLDVSFKPIQASAIATAILYYARKTCNIYPVWHEDLSHLTFHDPASSKSTMRALDLIFAMHKEPEVVDEEDEDVLVEEEDSFATSVENKEELLEDEHLQASMAKLGLVSPTKENQNNHSALALATPEMPKEKGIDNVNDDSPVSIAALIGGM